MTVVELDAEPPGFGEPGYDPFDDLWSRLSRPYEPIPAVAAVVGLPTRAVAQLVGLAVSTSPEARQLLATFPRTVRSLATSVQTHAERCVGSLRGPVLWSETMSARSASFGDPDLFVCSTPSRAYDVDENQVLVHALNELREAARTAIGPGAEEGPDHHDLREVRRNAAEATRFLEHPSLREVKRKKPRARALKRTRTSKHRKWYAPAMRMVERAATPLSVDDVRALCDERTRAQHHVLMGVVNRLELSDGSRLPAFRVEHGALVSDRVEFHPARYLGDRSSLSGIRIGNLLIDVPDRLHDPNRRRGTDLLRARAGGRQAMLVMDERDIDRAVELAIDLARTGRGAD
jgi:hypothetical protein